MKELTAILFSGAVVLLASCATQDVSGANDPYEATNRKIFNFNQQLDKAVMKPVAQAYVDVVPEPARDGVHNFLVNLNLPVTFANDILQGEIERTGETVARFTVNTTIGIGGLLDVATRIGVPFHTEDFGQTLAVWGVGEGPYLVLPLLGPKPPRDAVGYAVDSIAFDRDWIGQGERRAEEFWIAYGKSVLEMIFQRVPADEENAEQRDDCSECQD